MKKQKQAKRKIAMVDRLLYKLVDNNGNKVVFHTGQSLFTTPMTLMRVWGSVEYLKIEEKLALAEIYGVTLQEEITLRGVVKNSWPQELPQGWQVVKCGDDEKQGSTFLLNKVLNHIKYDDELLEQVRAYLLNERGIYR